MTKIGKVNRVGVGTIDVRVGGLQLHNVFLTAPLTISQVVVGDLVTLEWHDNKPWVKGVLAHSEVGTQRDDAVTAVATTVIVTAPGTESDLYLMTNGTRPLVNDWDAGNFKITAEQLASDVADGTPPLVVISTTMVDNLNADMLDGYDALIFPRKAEDAEITGAWTAGGDWIISGAWTFNANISLAAGVTIDGIELEDHSARHDPGGADALTTAAPGFTLSTSNAEGSAGSLIRSDATIALFDATTPTTIEPDDSAATGSAGKAARRDHSHAIVAAAPGAIEPDDGATEGSATSFARSDHQHSIVAAAPGAIEPDDSAVEGAATSFARSDHQHSIIAGAPTADLSVSTSNAEGSSAEFARKDHGHAITTSSNPGVAASILASDANGRLQFTGLGIGTTASGDHLALGDSVQIQWSDIVLSRGAAGIAYLADGDSFRIVNGELQFGADVMLSRPAANELQLAASDALRVETLKGLSAASLTIAPDADVIFDPTGNDILPNTNYDLNVGSLSKKYLTLHAAELWVETLVAQDTIATIGGRILVGPTTQFAADLSSATTNSAEKILNPDFETAGGGGADVFANWTEIVSDGSIQQDGTSQTGSYSCRMFAGSSADTHVYQDISVSDTDRIILRFWTRGNGTYAGRYRIYDNTNTADIISLTSTGITAATWSKLWVDFDIPSGCTSIRVYFYCPDTLLAYVRFDNSLARSGVQITTKHNQMAEGDIAYSEANASVEFFEMASTAAAAGSYWTYWTLRDLDGTGANNWYAGDALFNTGEVGDGFIDLYSYSGVVAGSTAGPTIVGNARSSDTYNDWTEHWAIGNLKGLYGYGVDTYGIGLGKYSEADYITIDPTDGIRFRDSSDVVQAQLLSSVWTLGASATENVYITSSAVQLRDGSTVYTDLSGGILTLGGASTENVYITNTAVQLRDGSTVYTDLSAGVLTLGSASTENVYITSTAVQLRDGSAVYTDLSAGVLTLGNSAAADGYYAKVASTYLRFYERDTSADVLRMELDDTSLDFYHTDGSTVLASIGSTITLYDTGGADRLVLNTSGITIGDVTEGEYLTASSSGIKLYGGAVQKFDLSNTGSLWVGDSASSERLAWDSTNGLRIYDKDNAAVMQVDPTDAIFKFGANVTAAATTALVIIGADATTYNSESLNEGDLLIGDNTASKANILWDKSTGQLEFRGGTTTQLYIDTDGSLLTGTGNLRIDDTDGITLKDDAGVGQGRIQWDANPSSPGIDFLWIAGDSTRYIHMYARGTTTGNYDGAIILEAKDRNNAEDCVLTISSLYKAALFENIYGSSVMDIRVEGGVWVGGIGSDPDAGDIHYEGQLRSYKNATSYVNYAYVPITTVKGWDGVSNKGNQAIDLQIAPFSLPPGIKAVSCFLQYEPTTPALGNYAYLEKESGDGGAVVCRVTNTNAATEDRAGIVNCDSNGDIRFGTNNSTNTVHLYIKGYWI